MITFERLENNQNDRPCRATEGSAGIDLSACLTRRCKLVQGSHPSSNDGKWFYSGSQRIFLDGDEKYLNLNDDEPPTFDDSPLTIEPHEVVMVPTGFKVQVPDRHVFKIFIRSSLSGKGLRLANSVGIVDSDYRGEVFILLWNPFNKTIEITNGQRIAQGIVEAAPYFPITEGKVDDTARGAGGFGSTGKHTVSRKG